MILRVSPEAQVVPRSYGVWICLVQDPLEILKNEHASTEIGFGIFFQISPPSESKDCSPCEAVGIHWFSIL